MNIVKCPIKNRRDDRPDTDHDSGYFPRIFELFFQHDLMSTKLEIALEMLSGQRSDYSAAPYQLLLRTQRVESSLVPSFERKT